MNVLSVVLCTRNRPRKLERALGALGTMLIPEGFSCELVVVDDNSTDDTASIIKRFTGSSRLAVKYVRAAGLGISNARNQALRTVQGALIAFSDDDCVVGVDWLNEFVQAFDRHPDVAMVFGRTRPYQASLPAPSTKNVEEFMTYTYPSTPWSIGHGNNMAMRASLKDEVGEFDAAMGVGTKVGSGSDTDYVFRVLKAGRKILYSPLPMAYHNRHINSLEGRRRIEFAYAKGRGAFYCKYVLRGDVWVLRLFLSELVRTFTRALFTGRISLLGNVAGLFTGGAYRLIDEADTWLRGRAGTSHAPASVETNSES